MLSDERDVRFDGEGVPAVLQGPGWGPGVDYLRRTLLPLLGGMRVMSYDVRNTGRAPRRPGPSSQATDELVADLDLLVAEQDLDPFVLIGHSHGAFVAMGYTIRHPRRVRALILLTPSLHERGATPGAEAILAQWEDDPERAEAVRWVRAHRRHPRETRHDRDVARWLRRGMPVNFYDLRAMERFQASLIDIPMPSVDALHGMPDRREPWVGQGLVRIAVPTLVVGAQYDVATPLAEAQEVADRIPAARLVVIDRAGHNPWAERPEEVGAAIAGFLADEGLG